MNSKMNEVINKMIVFIMVVIITSCQSSSQVVEKKEVDNRNWSVKMQSTLQALNELMPFVFSKKKFKDPKNTKVIQKKITEFHREVNGIKNHQLAKKPDQDPILARVSEQLEDDVKLALEAFTDGHFQYSQDVLKSTMNHCTFCHTRNKMGPELNISNDFLKENLLGLSEKADFFTATRQYGQALATLKKIILEETSSQYAFTIEKAFRSFLTISLRVKESPKEALAIIDQYLKRNEGNNNYLNSDIRKWKDDLLNWDDVKEMSVASTIEYVGKLLVSAKKGQNYSFDNSGDVKILKGTRELHKLLEKKLSRQQSGEVYFMLGESYETLKGVNSWTLNEFYYESCIKIVPHTSLAKKCYDGFERSILMGYSGSAGVFIPLMVRRKMASLKTLSM